MPYKNPEDKRRWEQEHREQRNARRREKLLGMQSPSTSPMPNSVSTKGSSSGWKMLASIAVAAGLILLAGLAGASGINTGMGQSGR